MRPPDSFIAQPVRSLQTMLRVIGEDDNWEQTIIPDGFYGDQTREAITRFQRERGLPSTGIADESTWQRIVAEYLDAMTRVAPATPLQLILNPGQVIRFGQSHPYLFLIQAMLAALEEAYGSIAAPPITGVLDLPTSDSLANFQRLSQLPATGELDKITWKHLALHYPLAVNKGYSTSRTVR